MWKHRNVVFSSQDRYSPNKIRMWKQRNEAFRSQNDVPSQQKTSTLMTPRQQACHVDATYSYGKYAKNLINGRGSGSSLSAAIYAGRSNNAPARAKQSVYRLCNTLLLCTSTSRIPPEASIASSCTFQKKKDKKKTHVQGFFFASNRAKTAPCRCSELYPAAGTTVSGNIRIIRGVLIGIPNHSLTLPNRVAHGKMLRGNARIFFVSRLSCATSASSTLLLNVDHGGEMRV